MQDAGWVPRAAKVCGVAVATSSGKPRLHPMAAFRKNAPPPPSSDGDDGSQSSSDGDAVEEISRSLDPVLGIAKRLLSNGSIEVLAVPSPGQDGFAVFVGPTWRLATEIPNSCIAADGKLKVPSVARMISLRYEHVKDEAGDHDMAGGIEEGDEEDEDDPDEAEERPPKKARPAAAAAAAADVRPKAKGKAKAKATLAAKAKAKGPAPVMDEAGENDDDDEETPPAAAAVAPPMARPAAAVPAGLPPMARPAAAADAVDAAAADAARAQPRHPMPVLP